VKKLIVTALAVGLAAALQPAAHAQFGSVCYYILRQSPTVVQMNTRKIISTIPADEQGQQIFTNTVKIATTALQAYNVAKQHKPRHQMIWPECSITDFCLNFRLAAATEYRTPMGIDGMAQFGEYGKGAHLPTASERATTATVIPGYRLPCCWQLQIAAQGSR